MKYLEEQAGDLLSKKGGQWSPLIVYKNGLKGHDAQQDKGMECEVQYQVQAQALSTDTRVFLKTEIVFLRIRLRSTRFWYSRIRVERATRLENAKRGRRFF